MTPSEFLLIMMYLLGSILLVVLIILGIKLIILINKAENVVDNINGKVNKLNALFSIIDVTAEKLALISDKVVDLASTAVNKMFNKKKRKEEEYE